VAATDHRSGVRRAPISAVLSRLVLDHEQVQAFLSLGMRATAGGSEPPVFLEMRTRHWRATAPASGTRHPAAVVVAQSVLEFTTE
jgi:hypothetical protein